MDEEQAKHILEKRQALCFYQKPMNDETVIGNYKQIMDEIQSHFPNPEYSDFSLSTSSDLYGKIGFYEEFVASSAGYWFGQLMNHEALVEDYDNSLPDNQNLWKVITNENPTKLEQIRMRNSGRGFRFDRYDRSNHSNHYERDKQGLTLLLNNQEAFEWYYSIWVNRRFTEKVQVKMEAGRRGIRIEQAVINLFRLFGSYFHRLFVVRPDDEQTERSMIFLSDQGPEMKQITFGFARRLSDFDSGYQATLDILNEIGRARGWIV